MQHVKTPQGNTPISQLKRRSIVVGWTGKKQVKYIVKEVKEFNWKTNRRYYLINNKYRFAGNQSIYANGRVTHVKLLNIGDKLQDFSGRTITVKSKKHIPKDKNYPFYRLELNHKSLITRLTNRLLRRNIDAYYYLDNILVHNASRFWILGTAVWDNSNTANWSTTSGGSGGAAVPTSADDVTFDSNSGTAATVTIQTATANANTITINKSDLTLTHSGVGSTVVGAVTLTTGTLNTNGQTCAWLAFLSNNSNTRALTLGASTLTLSSTAATAWTVNVSTGLTLSAASSTIIFTGSNSSSSMIHGASGGPAGTFGTVQWTQCSTAQLNTAAGTTFANLSITAFNSHTQVNNFNLISNITVTGILTLAGPSAVNRLTFQTLTPGTQSTITNTGATMTWSNVDIQDIALTTAFNASAITGNSGDRGGNSNITFTPAATQTHTSSAGGSWSDNTKWTSRVPLPQDNVVVDVNTTGTLTNDMPVIGASIDFTGFAGTLTSTVAPTMFGSLILSSTLTIITWGPTLSGRGSYVLTSAGRTFLNSIALTAPTGTYTLQDNLTMSSRLTTNNGTLNTNNFTVTINSGASAALVCNSPSILIFGTSTINIGCTAVTPVSFGTAASNISAASATFVMTSASTVSRLFQFQGGTSFGTITYTVANSPGVLTLSPTGTFNTINVSSARQLAFTSASTTTVTNFNVNGVNNGYLYLPGVAGNYVSAPSSSALNPSGDFTLDVLIAPSTWTPSAETGLIAKWQNPSQRGYLVTLLTTGKLRFYLSSDGANSATVDSSVAVGLSTSQLGVIRVAYRASDKRVQFFTSPDDVTYTQLGTDQTQTLAVFASTNVLEIGSWNTGNSGLFTGNLYRARVWSDITQTTKVFDSNFITKAFGVNSFTESSSNAATVTINGVLAQAGDGRLSITSSSGGTAATLSSNRSSKVDYLVIKDSTVIGNAVWYAGSHSVNVSGNTGWLFSGYPWRAPNTATRTLANTRTKANTRTLANTRTKYT